MSLKSAKPEEFQPLKEDIESYLSRFDLILDAQKVTDDKDKAVSLLTCIGVDHFAILRGSCAPEEPKDKSYGRLKTLLEEFYSKKPLIHVALVDFSCRQKRPNESINEFYTDLRILAKDCQFKNFEDRVRDQLFVGIRDEPYFRSLVSENMDWHTMTATQLKAKIDIQEKLLHTSRQKVQKVHKGLDFKKSGANGKNCKHCGLNNHKSDTCRFKNYKCNKCGIIGHLAKICRKNHTKVYNNDKVNKPDVNISRKSASAHSTHHTESDEDSNILCYVDNSNKIKPIQAKFLLNNTCDLYLEIDSGCSISTLSESAFLKTGAVMTQCNIHLNAYNNVPIEVLGQSFLSVCYLHPVHGEIRLPNFNFIIVSDSNVTNLCGRDLMEACQIILSGVNYCNQIGSGEELLAAYKCKESEPIKGQKINIKMKPGASPVFAKARNVPVHYKDKIEGVLREWVELGIIEQVNYSDWSSPIVPVLKENGKIRVCVDYKRVNDKIETHHFPAPRAEEIFNNLGNARVFSKLDLSNAYLQLEVDENDQKYLTMNTHMGLYKFRRLPFGMKNSSMIFCEVMHKLLGGIQGVFTYVDDILVVGSNKDEHDRRIKAVLEVLSAHNVIVNKRKCTIGAKELKFLGHILDQEGVKPDPSKLKSIFEAPKPVNAMEVSSFLGMVAYYSKFVKNFSTVVAPLYELIKKNVTFEWIKIHEDSFQLIKRLLCNNYNCLSSYMPGAQLVLECDASPTGVGAVLKQIYDGKESTIAFASKKLSPAEVNYSQIDREALGIVFGVQKFRDYLVGCKFILRTDHRPLVFLFNPAKDMPQIVNSRIQRWAILLATFDFQIEHISGKRNSVADMLSRLPIEDNMKFHKPPEYIHLINSLEGLDISLKNVMYVSNRDSILKQLKEYVKFGFPSKNNIDPIVAEFMHVKDDLTMLDDVLMYRNRVIIPNVMKKSVLTQLHAGHHGVQAMKNEARRYVYWPRIDQDIEDVTKQCYACIQNNVPIGIPTLSWPETDKIWSRVHIDYAGPIDNNYFLIVIDSHSKFMDVHVTKSITSERTIDLLKTCFSNFGLPDLIVSDNGRSFTSKEFSSFLEKNNVKHCKSAPYNPASNGLAERAVKTFKQYLKKFPNGNIKGRVSRVLYHYRRAILKGNDKSPAEIMFNRNFKSPLDVVKPKLSVKKEGEYQESKFAVNDAVFARNFGAGPEWVQGVITKVLGSRNYLVKIDVVGNAIVKRHLSQLFKRIFNSVRYEEEIVEENDQRQDNAQSSKVPAEMITNEQMSPSDNNDKPEVSVEETGVDPRIIEEPTQGATGTSESAVERGEDDPVEGSKEPVGRERETVVRRSERNQVPTKKLQVNPKAKKYLEIKIVPDRLRKKK